LLKKESYFHESGSIFNFSNTFNSNKFKTRPKTKFTNQAEYLPKTGDYNFESFIKYLSIRSNTNKLSWNDCIFESWIFQNLIREMSWNFPPNISFVNFRSRNWTHDLKDHPIDGIKHSSSRPLTDIKRILVVERFQFIVSTHPEHNQNYTVYIFSNRPFTPGLIHFQPYWQCWIRYLCLVLQYKQFSLILIGLGPIALDFPYISEELTDKSN
jgi:hypothetical protein